MATRRNRTDGFIDPCIPTLASKPPSGPDWVHEIKHDGYGLIVHRDGETVRLFTRRRAPAADALLEQVPHADRCAFQGW
jgi:ATP-dependent DNA ligase